MRDRNPDLTSAWSRHFEGVADVLVSTGDIFDGDADAIVSPANSFGYMNGGIDAVYAEHFPPGLQARLQTLLRDQHFGELPVGQAVIVATQDRTLPWLVSAPTMRVPSNVAGTANAYLAFRAALIAVIRHNAAGPPPIATLLCPGLATTTGRIPVDRCARQMRFAWDVTLGGRPWPTTMGGIYVNDRELTGNQE